MSITISPETIRCVICLCAESTMLSFDTQIEIEGIQICCGTMYRRFIGLEEVFMAHVKKDLLKLCLACLTQLNACYLFQQQAKKSADSFLQIIKHGIEPTAAKEQLNKQNLGETILEIAVESTNQDCTEEDSTDGNDVCQIHEEIKIESLDEDERSENSSEKNEAVDNGYTILPGNDSHTDEAYLNEAQEMFHPADIHEKSATNNQKYIDTSSNMEESDAETETTTDQGEQPPHATVSPSKFVGTAERAVQCAVCGQVSETETLFHIHFLLQHVKQGSDESNVYCIVCKRYFKSRKSFNQHIRIHQTHKRYECQFCSKSFHYSHHMKKHELTHTHQKPYACERCPKAFRTKECLANHKTQHEPRANVPCDMCSLYFKTVKCVNKHKLMKHDVAARYFDPYACQQCGKMLRSQSVATYHAKLQCTTNTLGPASWYIHCPVCKIQFDNRTHLEQHLKAKHDEEDLQNHLRQHKTKSSAFECDVCGMRFAQSVVLRRHKMRHEGVKPYQCEHCQRCFAQKGTLKTHLRTHTDERPFQCPTCGNRFRSAGSLRTHRLRACKGLNAIKPVK